MGRLSTVVCYVESKTAYIEGI